MLVYSGFLGSKLVSTTSDLSSKLHNDTSQPYHDIPCSRRLVGMLLYLNATEYYALGAASCEFPWLMYLLKDLHVES